jgi:hypothetical protein
VTRDGFEGFGDVGVDVVGEFRGRGDEIGSLGEGVENHLLDGVEAISAHGDQLRADV